MDMFDEARAISGTLELCSLTQDGLARQMGVSQSYIANKLRLLNLSDTVQKRVRASGLSERHARALLRLDDEKNQLSVLDKVVSGALTVRECEALVDAIAEPKITKLVGKAEKRERVGAFLEGLRSGLDSLSSLGVDASMHKSYHGDRLYVTLSIIDN